MTEPPKSGVRKGVFSTEVEFNHNSHLKKLFEPISILYELIDLMFNNA